MRTLVLVTLWTELLAIIAGIVCSVFGFRFFYFGPAIHVETITFNDQLFSFFLLGIAVCFVASTRRGFRFQDIAALLFCWSVSLGFLGFASLSFVESYLTSDSTLVRYHRMECMVLLVIGVLLKARLYHGLWRRRANA